MSPSALTRWALPDGSTHHLILGLSYAFWRILAMVSGLCLRPYMGLNSPRRVPVIVADILRRWSSVSPFAWGCLSPSFACRMRSRPSGVCHDVLSRHRSTMGRFCLFCPITYSLTFSTWENLIINSRGFGTSCSEFSSTIQYSFFHPPHLNRKNLPALVTLKIGNHGKFIIILCHLT